MRKLILFLLLTSAWGALEALAESQGKPIPPGVREGDKLANAPLEAPVEPKHRYTDRAQLKREAEELAKLSASVPGQIELVTRGQLPKDLTDRLKRIEKLAKTLRSEIAP